MPETDYPVDCRYRAIDYQLKILLPIWNNYEYSFNMNPILGQNFSKQMFQA